MARYWRRWGGQTDPLRVVQVFRRNADGTWQSRAGEEWITVPGDGLAGYVFDGTMVDEITAAQAETGLSTAEQIVDRLMDASLTELDAALNAAAEWLDLRPQPWGEVERQVTDAIHIAAMKRASPPS